MRGAGGGLRVRPPGSAVVVRGGAAGLRGDRVRRGAFPRSGGTLGANFRGSPGPSSVSRLPGG